MSTLTWITEEKLERKVKKQGDQFRWKKNITILYITTVRKREKVSGHQSENEQQRKKREQELIKRVTRKFLEVSRCSREAIKCTKKACFTCKEFFFFANWTYRIFGCFRWCHRLALHDFIFYLCKL